MSGRASPGRWPWPPTSSNVDPELSVLVGLTGVPGEGGERLPVSVGPEYGPNSEDVATLVGRCRVLTPAELRRLQVALPSSFLTTTDEAWIAALGVAQAENVGRKKAWKATFRAVVDAVEGAVPRCECIAP